VSYFDLVSYFGEVDSGDTGNSMRLVRIVRALRLLRLIKLKKFAETIMDHIDSDYFHLLLGMAKGTLFVLGMNHLIACSWFGISSLTSEGVDSWTRSASFEIEEGLSYKYLTALHWSLTQFTPASMEIVPRNVHERAFAVCVLIFALIVFSSFVSSITASMTQLRQLSWKFTKDLSTLRKYLRSRDISGVLSIRIVRFVEYKLEKKSNEIAEGDVKLLSIVSAQLRMELAHESYSPILSAHPFFHQFSLTAGPAMLTLCNDAVSPLSFSMGDVVFEDRTKSDSMMFLNRGMAQYFCRFEKLQSGPGNSTLESGEWCCEAALWTYWEHVGAMHAVENADFLTVNAAKLVQVVDLNGFVAPATWLYACRFVEELNELSMVGGLTDLNSIEQEVLDKYVTEAFVVESTTSTEDELAASTRSNAFNKAHIRMATFTCGGTVARSSRGGSWIRHSSRTSTGSSVRVHRIRESVEFTSGGEDMLAGAIVDGAICSLDDEPPEGDLPEQGSQDRPLGGGLCIDGQDDGLKDSL